MGVFPDKMITYFVYVLVTVSTFSFLVNGLASVHEEIDEVSGTDWFNRSSVCDFSQDERNEIILDYPNNYQRRGLFYRLFPSTIETPGSEIFWADSGDYASHTIEAQEGWTTGEDNLYLTPGQDSPASGNYYIRWGLQNEPKELKGTTLNTLSAYVSLVNESEFIVDVRIVDENNSVSFQKDFNLGNESTINYVLDLEGYEIKPTDEILQVTITGIDERATIQEPMSEFKEFKIYGEYIETYNLKDYSECSIKMVLDMGTSLYLDTGIPVIDGLMSVFGTIAFLVSVVIALILFVLSLGISALQFVIL